jgi:serine/threonine-protein kinase
MASFYLNFGQSVKSSSGVWYKNIQVLGSGGNGTTFLVLCTSGTNKGELFALKVFRNLGLEERKAKFQEEIKFLLSNDHPCNDHPCNDHPSIMRVYDAGDFKNDDGVFPFLVAEYLPETLLARMARKPALADKVVFITQLLSGLAWLSSLDPQRVHRDIKPQNIFIKGKSCVLGDFGLMKALDNQDADAELLKTSQGPGMPFYYRTPDMVDYYNGKALLTVATDVFQLGLVAAQLFTGRNPCKPFEDYSQPFALDNLGHIPGKKFGALIAAAIKEMLDPNPVARASASVLLDKWQGIFEKVARPLYELDEEVLVAQ